MSRALARGGRRRSRRSAGGASPLARPRRARAALQSFLPGRAVALSRRRDARNGAHARAPHEGAWLAPAALDRRQGSAGDDTDPAIARAPGRDRPYGTHRRPRRHGHGRLSKPAAAARCRRLLGEAVRPAPDQPQCAGLSGRAALPAGSGGREPRATDLGRRLAAPAHGRRDAGGGTPPRPVPGVDAGCRNPPPHPGRQSGAALRIWQV